MWTSKLSNEAEGGGMWTSKPSNEAEGATSYHAMENSVQLPSPCVSIEDLNANLECPVCLDLPQSGPIYQCRNGHLMCKDCHSKMKRCPICVVPLENLRNLFSEKLLSLTNPNYIFSIDRVSSSQDVIWQGQLKWKEISIGFEGSQGMTNGGDSIQPAQRSIDVYIKSTRKNGVLEVVPANWPASLTMQLLPLAIMRRAGKKFFSNSSTVLFEILDEQNELILKGLLNKSGMVGCVHFIGAPTCGTKVMILAYSREKDIFIGFIPTDQIQFIQRVRDEIELQKSKTSSYTNTALN